MKQLLTGMLLLLILSTGALVMADPAIRSLAPNLIVIESGAWENNMVVLRGTDGLVVIDSLSSPRMAREALAAIRMRWPEPVRSVILTHHHWDHAFGLPEFIGAEIIAHNNVPGAWAEEYPDLKRQRNASGRHIPNFERDFAAAAPGSGRADYLRANVEWLKQVNRDLGEDFALPAPHRTVGDRQTITRSGFTIDLYHIDHLHTPGDLIIHVREAGLVCVGDLFYARSLPVLHRGIAIDRWLPQFTALRDRRQEVRFVVSGHGELIEADHLMLYFDYLAKLLDSIRAGRNSGLDAARTAAELDLAPFSVLGSVTATHADNVAFYYEQSSQKEKR